MVHPKTVTLWQTYKKSSTTVVCGTASADSETAEVLAGMSGFVASTSTGKSSHPRMRFGQLAELRNAIRHSRQVTPVMRNDGEAAIGWFHGIFAARGTASDSS